MTDSLTHNPTHNLTDNVFALARRLADTHDVDLSALAKGPDNKITARNVLEHLSTTAEPAKRRGELPLLPETEPETENAANNTLEAAAVAANAQPESLENEAEQVQTPEAPHVPAGDPALERTRAQLQATAQVHQQAMMQVGSLRERNSALEQETERLRAAEAEAQAELQRLAEQKAQLERELERSKSGAFS